MHHFPSISSHTCLSYGAYQEFHQLLQPAGKLACVWRHGGGEGDGGMGGGMGAWAGGSLPRHRDAMA